MKTSTRTARPATNNSIPITCKPAFTISVDWNATFEPIRKRRRVILPSRSPPRGGRLRQQPPAKLQLLSIHLPPVSFVIIAAEVKNAMYHQLAHLAIERVTRLPSLKRRRVGRYYHVAEVLARVRLGFRHRRGGQRLLIVRGEREHI